MTVAQPLKAGLIFETIQQVHPHSDHDQRQSRDTRTNLSPSRSKRPVNTRTRAAPPRSPDPEPGPEEC